MVTLALSEGSSLWLQEDEQLAFHVAQRALHQGSSQASRVLAGVHHELAKLHQGGRFGEPLDWEAVLFHERKGAELGCVEAMLNMGLFMQDRASDLLEKCPIKVRSPVGGESSRKGRAVSYSCIRL